ncbi:serine/threonine-protein kinase [Actinomadura harenae]|uniref:serine/threonine-protein kinase n=1 Tax=Actinomadura harenae TaxID=2483351 RepID=UPI00131525CB|nr:serine/threonine-protein kinase [Actinomadura harenae]
MDLNLDVDPLEPTDPGRVGSYRLRGRIGAGGMGQVYLGRNRGGRLVAVKLVRQSWADDPQFRQRFEQEVEAARKVGGFYTAHVVDTGLADTPPWVATAYIPGLSLQEAVHAHGPFSAEAIEDLGAGLADALAHIHECGLVHRDITPSNVILAVDGGVRVIDFGIARALDVRTTTGTDFGTPAYMSPEHARGEPVGPAGDVYSLGRVLVFAATGRNPSAPHVGPDHEGVEKEASEKVASGASDLATLPGSLPDDLITLITDCLAEDPAQRPSVSAILSQLAPDYDGTVRLSPDITEKITRRGKAADSLSAISGRFLGLAAVGLAAIAITLTVVAVLAPGQDRRADTTKQPETVRAAAVPVWPSCNDGVRQMLGPSVPISVKAPGNDHARPVGDLYLAWIPSCRRVYAEVHWRSGDQNPGRGPSSADVSGGDIYLNDQLHNTVGHHVFTKADVARSAWTTSGLVSVDVPPYDRVPEYASPKSFTAALRWSAFTGRCEGVAVGNTHSFSTSANSGGSGTQCKP